ncbi:putative RNA-binding protein Luc7-like 1 [Camelus dromedarius]|uniref:Putative RNA-binding protein Luc7-like 1 n=1 Tax=Camelus dromedarius TaxID=9838 RepID=A0A5N4BZK7_CAMDR|nr:putative RNA-binding protein Luc7-like 1 [Camelus dromedarius]
MTVHFYINTVNIGIGSKYLKEEYRNSMPASSFQQQKLRVCEVCSATLVSMTMTVVLDHFGAKNCGEKQEKRNQGCDEEGERRDAGEAEQEVWIKNQRSQEVAFPDGVRRRSRSTSRERKVFPVPVPRQTPAPPKPLRAPQPGPPPGIQDRSSKYK